MTPSKENANAGSVWIRFWSPTSALEPTPAHASAPERAAIRSRNYVWLKTYMDIYILRWGALWAACLVLALLATDDAVPGYCLRSRWPRPWRLFLVWFPWS